MLTNFKRILRSGVEKFARDRSSTGASLVVMTIVLFVVGSLLVLQGMGEFLVLKLQEGVDMSAYIRDTAPEEEVSRIRADLLALDQVKEVEYVSKEEALVRFREAYQGEEEILDPLDAIGRNPLLAHFNIKTTDPEAYSKIAEFLQGEAAASVIADIDFHDREPVIERISLIVKGIRAGVLAVIVALSAIAVLVAFNTIRLTIYGSKEEIEVMRLVGASNWFIRGPFLVQGVLVGVASTACALLLLFVLSFFASSELESFTGFDLSSFLISQIFLLLCLQLLVGIGLGIVSSFIAIRTYLKV